MAVACPAENATACHVRALGHGATRRLRFAIPPGRVSRLRLEATPPTRRRLTRGDAITLVVGVTARADASGRLATHKRVRVLLRPTGGHGQHLAQPGRAFTGLAAPDPRTSAGSVAPAGAPVLGISEQHPAMFGDPRFTALGIHAARLVVPWDVADSDARMVDAWLAAAALAGVEPFVAFDHAREDQCPAAPCRLPSVTAYEDAVRAFLSAHPEVRTVTPWNEPNHAAEPTAGRPDRAAAYYDAVRRACPSCTLVAGDVIDGGDWTTWIRQYRDALGETPTTWGLHDYYDTTYFHTTGLQTMLGLVTGDVWLTETGGIVELRTRDGQISLPPDERRASASVSLALDAARTYASRVTRVYLYQWQTNSGARFDAGLLRPDGSARPAYDAVRAQSGAFASSPSLRTSAPSPAGIAAPGRVIVRTSGHASVRVRCPSAPATPCRGRLWLVGAAFAAGTLVNGHTPGSVLGPVTRSIALSDRRSATLRFTIGRPVMAHAGIARALALRVMVSTAADPLALHSRYVVRLWRPQPATKRHRS